MWISTVSLSRSSSGYDENDGSFYVDSALTLTDDHPYAQAFVIIEAVVQE